MVTISRFGVSSVDFWLWCTVSFGFVSFLLQCLGRIDLSVAFSSIAALVATGKTFVISATAAVCFWKLGIRVLIFVSFLFRLGFMYLIPPNLLWVIFPFRLDWPMSQLIRSRKTVTTAPRSIPPPPTLSTTAPAEMDLRLVNLIDLVGPWVSQVLASSVALPISAKHGHHLPRTPDTTLASTIDGSESQQGKVKQRPAR
ncbi:hypothetical protein DVH24_029748 [Malus domestica]|uniref:Uncharacterized protein n=1 Tax=Malus domestica TaxID=3750 RepID=A0A498HZI9_MALDO|nr:hypothetical protein DVH24_029748 [Malus domestica]